MEYTNQLMSSFFKSLAHPTRIQILRLLEKGPLCVCDILPQLESEQSNTSQHLSVLRQSGILSSRRDGTKVIYSVEYPQIYQILGAAEIMLKNQVKEINDKMNPSRNEES